MRKTIVFLLLFLVVSINLAHAQDVTKLVRIQEGDSWVYSTAEGNVIYNVTDTYINTQLKEINTLNTNATVLPTLLAQYSDGAFSFNIQIANWTLGYSSRGNFLVEIQGDVNVTLRFDSNSTNLLKSGILWSQISKASHNLAIVTGEPQMIQINFIIGGELNETRLEVTLNYLVIPSNPFNTTYQTQDVIAVTLKEQIDSIEIFAQLIEGTASQFYQKTLGKATIYSEYDYAQEIGLPIEIRKNIPISMGLGASVHAIETEELIDYSIEEAKLKIIISKTTDFPFIFVFNIFILLSVIQIIKVRRERK